LPDFAKKNFKNDLFGLKKISKIEKMCLIWVRRKISRLIVFTEFQRSVNLEKILSSLAFLNLSECAYPLSISIWLPSGGGFVCFNEEGDLDTFM